MQEQTTTKEGRRPNPIHVVETSRPGASSADALREVHMSLVRAEQNLYNLVQASQAGNGIQFAASGFGYPSPPPGFASPGFAAGFAPSTIGTPAGLAYGTPWASPWTGGIPALHTPGNGLASALWTGIANRTPACDVKDEGQQFTCVLDLPGVNADQVEVSCFDRAVVINAARERDGDIASLVQSERGNATMQRTITLPSEIQPGGAKASLSNGILTVVLPKLHPTEGPRRVKVQG